MPGDSPPNIVYLHSHDTGRYVQPYGYPVDTPNIQRLAEQGVQFRQAFSAAPTCSPSRAALLTGQCPHSAGMLGLAHRGFQLNDPGQHLAHALRDHGFATALAGTQHVTSNDPRELGYETICSVSDPAVEHVAPAAVEYIESIDRVVGDRPFFLDVGFFETHRPFPSVDPAASRYVQPPAVLPDTPETRLDMAGFHASVRELDRGVGLVLNALERAGLMDRTLIICTTDHGLPFPGMKCNLTDHGTGVMLILRGPGGFTGGRVIDALVSQIDLFPTLCDLTGVPQPEWLQGTSFLPPVSGERQEIRDSLFTEVTFHAAYEPQRAIRTKRWTYIRRYGDRLRPVLPNCDAGETRDFVLQNGWPIGSIDRIQLYDNLLDPMHRNNLMGHIERTSVLQDLRRRLDRWMMETDDPLLYGDVPLPPGASMNDPDSLSPDDELIVAEPVDEHSLLANPEPTTSALQSNSGQQRRVELSS